MEVYDVVLGFDAAPEEKRWTVWIVRPPRSWAPDGPGDIPLVSVALCDARQGKSTLGAAADFALLFNLQRLELGEQGMQWAIPLPDDYLPECPGEPIGMPLIVKARPAPVPELVPSPN